MFKEIFTHWYLLLRDCLHNVIYAPSRIGSPGTQNHGAYLVRSERLNMRNEVLLEFWTNLNKYKHNYHNCGKQVVLAKQQGKSFNLV